MIASRENRKTRNRFLGGLGFTVAAAAATIAVSAQRASQRVASHPDFQGLWTNGTLTPLTRPDDLKDKAVFTKEEAAEYERTGLQRTLKEIPPDDLAMGSDLNDTYLETSLLKVVPDRRTSLVVDPADGRLPPQLPQAQERNKARPKRDYDDPETLSLDERCLMGTTFGSSQLAPPMVPNLLAENYYQIVQTDNAVMIYTELVHDARVIRIGGVHPPAAIQKWLGDSIGRWEGDTLVVDTTNYTPKTHFRGSSEHMHVVERFTRVDARTIKYMATVEDPETWARSWTVEVPFHATTTPILEYACHEGNRAIENFLRGARAEEKRKSQ